MISIKIISVICEHIKKFGSIALIIDYGETFGFGDTLQAIRSHTPEFILDNPGESDLSSHVNFSILAKVALERDLFVSPIIEQFKFLKNLGIENRLDQLIKLNTEKKIESEINGIKKLIDPESMGTLFKVLAIFDSKGSNIEGFSWLEKVFKAHNLREVKHGFFGRVGGSSKGIYSSLNVSYNSADKPQNIIKNREIISESLRTNSEKVFFIKS